MSKLIEDIRKPISEATPCGEDVINDDDYGGIHAEINKTAGNDWKMIVRLGSAILAQKSKNLNVATWLCIGLLQLQGFDGLADGLEGYLVLLQEYWDGLYPQRPRARESAVRMLGNKLGGDPMTMGLVEARQATASDVNALQRIHETLKALNDAIQDKFGGQLSIRNIAAAIEDKLTSIGASLEETPINAVVQPLSPQTPSTDVSQPAAEEPGIVDTKPSGDEKQEASPVNAEGFTASQGVAAACDALTRRLPQPSIPPQIPVQPRSPPAGKATQEAGSAKEKPPAAPSPATTSQRTVKQPQTTAEETVPAATWKTRAEAINTIVQVAAFLRSQNPQDVIPYRLLRSIRWDIWQELPSDWLKNNKTSFPLPQSERKASFDSLVKSESWEALLKQSEELFAEGNCHFWFDLQRYIDTALKGLGVDYDAVRKAILWETAMLVDRLPKIIELSYRDGTEFADKETKAWVKKEVLPALSVEGAVVTQDTENASLAQGDVETEQKSLQSEVTAKASPSSVSSAAQQIDIGGDGAKVEISIKIFTR